MQSRISSETLLLAGICIADMLLTIIFVQCRMATEHNPLMAACLNRGVSAFVIVKLASFVPFVALAEIHRRRNPVFVRSATRCAIVLYLGVYATMLVRVNLLG